MSRFVLYPPCEALRACVQHFAVSESADNQAYKVLPGVALVMGFQYTGKLWQVTETGESPLAAHGITGLMDQFRTFRQEGHTGTVLVYFSAMGAAWFFRPPLHELFLQSVPLDTFFRASALEEVHERLAAATDDAGRILAVETFLLGHLRPPAPDRLVEAAVRHIVRAKGSLQIRQLAADLHTSQSPLEKRFRSLVGTSPKKFASVVRFRSLLNEARLQPDQLLDIGYAHGYHDHAHFIHDFRRFTGETPGHFFREG